MAPRKQSYDEGGVMSALNPLEQEMALELANKIKDDLEAFKAKMHLQNFKAQFNGVFSQALDGSISVVKPKPFVQSAP